jgi:hypothetical protein
MFTFVDELMGLFANAPGRFHNTSQLFLEEFETLVDDFEVSVSSYGSTCHTSFHVLVCMNFDAAWT